MDSLYLSLKKQQQQQQLSPAHTNQPALPIDTDALSISPLSFPPSVGFLLIVVMMYRKHTQVQRRPIPPKTHPSKEFFCKSLFIRLTDCV